MKSIFTLFAFMALTHFGLAQPVISNVVPYFGDQIVYNQKDGAPSPGDSGADVTWDFSGDAIDQYTANYTIESPENVEGSDQFQDATVVNVVDAGFIVLNNYLSFTNNTFTEYGSVFTSGGITSGRVYDNPLNHFTYPLNYLDTGSDTYDGNVLSAAGENAISGESSYIIDGYGTIQTPFGTYENALRITTTKVEDLTLNSLISTSNITETTWYSTDYALPVFIIEVSRSTVSGLALDSSFTTTALVSYNAAPSGINQAIAGNPFAIYPNPATDHITISSDFQGAADLIIYSVDGKMVAQMSVRRRDKIDVSVLQAGYYMACLTYNEKLYARRAFVIK